MKILVVKNRAMGDSILTLSSLQYIKEVLPQSILTYAIPGWILPLYRNVDIAADSLVSLPKKGLRAHLQFFIWLKKEKFDVVIDLHQRASSGRFLRLSSFILGYRYFFHNHHQKNGSFVHDQGVIKANIQRDLDAVWSVLTKGIKMANLKLPLFLNYPPLMKNDSTKINQICMGIVATRAVKMWPLEYYAEIACRIAKADPACKIVVPLSKSAQDVELQSKLSSYDLPKQLEFVFSPLPELPSTIARSRLYVGNDTGLKHIAVATGVPSFTFFGPEDPTEWHPYDMNIHSYFFIGEMPCRYQNAHFCGLETCSPHQCLRAISVDLVWERICPFFTA